MEKLTVFTPTYNRKKTLQNLYNSLLEQNNKDFCWMIIDDGSTDETESLIKGFISENLISITYIYKENEGKMATFNKAIDLCNTDYFVCVDSDDYLAKDAVKNILEYMDLIGNDDKLIGIIAYRGKDSNTIISNEFPIQDDTTLFNLYDKGFHGDTTLVFKTKFLKKYYFPIIPNEKFITENVLYYEIDKKYKYRLVPTILTIGDYQNDGYTINSNKIIKDNPLGWSLYFIKKAYLQKKYLNKLKFIIQSLSLYFYANDRKRLDLYSYLNKFDYIYLPIGYILGIARKIKYSFSR